MLVPEQGQGEDELIVLAHFSSLKLKDHQDNHVVPCLDSFPIPGVQSGSFVIMPLLGQYNKPPFKSLAEVHDFLQQLFKGLIFMHANDTVHRDIASPNIMMDPQPLYDEPFHPFHKALSLDTQRIIYPKHSRLEKRLRYYFIDMGSATWFRDLSLPRLTTGRLARILAPEQKADRPYDPFAVDTYQLDPTSRPPLTKAQQFMNTAFLGLRGVRYRWPLAPQEAGLRAKGIYFIWGVVLEIRYWLEKCVCDNMKWSTSRRFVIRFEFHVTWFLATQGFSVGDKMPWLEDVSSQKEITEGPNDKYGRQITRTASVETGLPAPLTSTVFLTLVMAPPFIPSLLR
ncbi:Pkinase domain-containing protein [Rhizoctonia solani AG-1 IA]|uniref:Pkinase domain-containing protein n=1 Tax=Thanatephorus cucumeris (strain AG1-IA) TaxID=983506 RepID=L8X7R7_THACA|nr:Pkinase domain-containing protein [Rhizoctonia solani AG-1 IA]